MELLCCDQIINCGSDTDWGAIIASVGAVLVGIIALVVSYFQYQGSLNAKKEEEERSEIHKKLNDFYGPLLQLRKKSNLLYQKFSEEYKTKDANFSTLIYLLDGKTFLGNESVLLNAIIDIGEVCEKLIHDKAGLIDDTYLRTEVIPRATTHFLVLRLAHKKALIGEIDKFRTLTFPKELDGLLEDKKKQLENRLNELNKTT